MLLTLAGLPGCLGLGSLDPIAPIPQRVGVSVDGEIVTVQLRGLENTNGMAVEMCLRDVVIVPSDGGDETCEFEEVLECLVVSPRTIVGVAPFRGRAVCTEIPDGWVRVMADVSFREKADPDHPWQTTTLLTEARLEVGGGARPD